MKDEDAVFCLIILHSYSIVKRIFLSMLVLFVARAAVAQQSVGPLEVDSTFALPSATPGRLTFDFGGIDIAKCYIAYFNRITRQASPIFVGGTADENLFCVVRVTPDGIPDPTFGTNGKATPFGGRGYPRD